jgi:choline kinase
MDVLILAAGLGSRLAKYTHNKIPKYLVNLDNNTGLYYIINYWIKYTNNIYLVIHSNYNTITKFYINNILQEYAENIHIINYDNSDGTAYTLNYILNNNDLLKKNIENLLITWCDLYPSEPFLFKNLPKSDEKNNIYVFTHGNKCRYLLNNKNKIIHVPESNGNILGIFYFQNYVPFFLGNSCKDNDIVNYLEIIGNVFNYEINNIIDYGDEEKLLNIIKLEKNDILNCRYFNKITIIDDTKLLKSGITDKGKELIQIEKKWYEYLNNLTQKNLLTNIIPKIYNLYENGFLMEYKKNYIPLYSFFKNYEDSINILNNNKDKNLLSNIIPNFDNIFSIYDENEKYIKNAEYNIAKITIIKNIIEKLSIIHNIEKKIEPKVSFLSNLKKEIYDKIIDRKKIIDPLINYFGNITKVNKVNILSFENILEKCKKIIVQYYTTIDIYEYSIILGDCQFSNILIDPDNISNICFIDPRGYFGNSNIFGPVDYDYAKLLYAISGYDKFNAEYFNIINIDNENNSIEFKIDPIVYDKLIINKYFTKIHKAYLVLIWLSLAEYTKNNIWKCIGSYYYGLYLGTIL